MPARPPSHVDPRSPLAIDTRELGRRPGSMIELRREIPAPGDWQQDLVRVPAGSSVSLGVRLESVVDGVLVTVELGAAVEGECGRCLDPISEEIDVNLAELFVYEPDPEDEEIAVLDGDIIDLEPVLRDAVVLALPFNPVCDETCAGLCVTCGARLDDVEPDHNHEDLDPRWASLAALKSGIMDADPASPKPSSVSSATMDTADANDPSASSIRES